MKCPKCSYVSHDYLDACRKCSTDLVEFKQKFKLMILQPGNLDLGELVEVGAEGIVDRDRFHIADAISDTLHGASHMTNGPVRKVSIAKSQRGEAGLNRTPVGIEVDIQFDADSPTPSTEPGELTRTFYVPEELAKQTLNMNLLDHTAEMGEKLTKLKMDTRLNTDNPTTSTEPGGLTKMFYVGLNDIPVEPKVDIQSDTDNTAPLAENTPDLSQATPDEAVPQASAVASAQSVQNVPGNTLDMSVGKLDDSLDEFDAIQLDTTEIDHDITLAFNLPSTAEEIPSVVDSGTPEKAREEMISDISNTAGVDKTPKAMCSEAQEEPFASDIAIDNLADDEPGLELEITDDGPSFSEEHNAGTETGRMHASDAKEMGRQGNDGGELLDKVKDK
jgi:hypothetical protein